MNERASVFAEMSTKTWTSEASSRKFGGLDALRLPSRVKDGARALCEDHPPAIAIAALSKFVLRGGGD